MAYQAMGVCTFLSALSPGGITERRQVIPRSKFACSYFLLSGGTRCILNVARLLPPPRIDMSAKMVRPKSSHCRSSVICEIEPAPDSSIKEKLALIRFC